MEPTDRNAAKPRLTRAQWKRRKRLRLARNWAILILVCAAIVALMTKGILWLLPKVNAMLAGPQSFDAASYDGTGYSFDADDERFVLVNTNLPFAEEPSPALADADEASGIQLEAEAAAAYQKMAAAAAEDGVALVLTAGYQDADARSAAYETQKQQYLEKGKTEEEAASLAADIQPPAECNDHGTGYAADILSTDYPTRDTGFDTTRAYEWLTAYAAEYGFILRYPKEAEAVTEITYELKARSSNAPYQQLRVYRRFDWQSSDLAALADRQIEVGLCSLAVPVLSRHGQVVAALNVGVPAATVSAAALKEKALAPLRRAAMASMMR